MVVRLKRAEQRGKDRVPRGKEQRGNGQRRGRDVGAGAACWGGSGEESTLLRDLVTVDSAGGAVQ